MSTEWTFEPVEIDKWEFADCRILVVGAGSFDSDESGTVSKDMGTWFRTALLTNDFHGNRSFFTRNLIQVMGAETRFSISTNGQPIKRDIRAIGSSPTSAFEAEFAHAFRNWIGTMRYLDLKPNPVLRIQEPSVQDWYDQEAASNTTNGKLVALHDEIIGDLKDNLEYFLSYWISDPEENEDDLEPPTITVIQGAVAEKVFRENILPVLREKGIEGQWVVMPHPSERLKLDTLWKAAKDLQEHLSPLEDKGYAWRSKNRKWVSLK